MAGGEWLIKLKFFNVEKLLLVLLGIPFTCLAQDAETGNGMPSVELLEFLGRWETGDGNWMNPNIFADSELGAMLDSVPINNDDNVDTDDSANDDNDSGGADND